MWYNRISLPCAKKLQRAGKQHVSRFFHWRRHWPRSKWWQEWHHELWVCEWYIATFVWSSYSFLGGPPFFFCTRWMIAYWWQGCAWRRIFPTRSLRWLLVRQATWRFIWWIESGMISLSKQGLQKHGCRKSWEKESTFTSQILMLVNIRTCSTWRLTQTRWSYFGRSTDPWLPSTLTWQ